MLLVEKLTVGTSSIGNRAVIVSEVLSKIERVMTSVRGIISVPSAPIT